MGPAGVTGATGPAGPTGPTGLVGADGPQGIQGPTGTVAPVQPYLSANLAAGTVPANGNVTGWQVPVSAGITYDGAATFTVSVAGLYYIGVVLNKASGQPANTVFALNISGTPNVGAITDSDTAGNSVLMRVQNLTAGSTIVVQNATATAFTLGQNVNLSAGKLVIFRFASGPIA